jgi:ABC-2 type transport system ATP-binding protein
MPAQPPIIEVDNLVKRYRKAGTNAVDGISFVVEQGQVFALLGPNGAGKTTTISILTTTLSPTSGKVCIAGYDVATQAAAVRSQVGIIFQHPSLDQNLSAEQNIRFHAVLYGLYPFRFTFHSMPKAYRQQVTDLAAVMGLEADINKPVKTFSGGMRRKLEIIRSLIHRPKVLFLDEPTLGLDPGSRRNLWQYLLGIRNEYGTTTFLTTHYLEEAEQAASICIMSKGRIIARGTPRELRSALVEDYLLVDTPDRARLRSELRALGVPFVETPLFRIAVEPARVHQLLRTVSTSLSSVQLHTPTLEDAYLAIVGRDEEQSELTG